MKKILCLLLCLLLFAFYGCEKPQEIEESMPIEEEIEKKTQFPVKFSLDNTAVSVNEIIETRNIEFKEGETTIKLNNSRGKYIRVNYSIKNNESFDLDMEHSVKVSLICKNDVIYGECYEDKTGLENLMIKPEEEKNISFICDVENDKKPDKIVFRYKDKQYELEL